MTTYEEGIAEMKAMQCMQTGPTEVQLAATFRRVGASAAAASVLAVSLALAAPGGALADGLPSMRIVFQQEGDVTAVVPKGTSQARLTELVVAIHCAFKRGNLNTLGIRPGTTGRYPGVRVIVYDDPRAASSERVTQCADLDMAQRNFAQKNRACINEIKAVYEGNSEGSYGQLGYSDRLATSSTYKPLSLPEAKSCPAR